MKAKVFGGMTALLALSAWLGGTLAIRGQGPQRGELREFMRQKLDRAQRILEGITLEDYDLIVKNAAALRDLSEDARWKVSPDIHYFRLGAQFQTIADELVEKARQKNLDGATLAYLDLTMSCVKCHRLVRDKRLVSFAGPGEGPSTGRPTP